MEQATRKGTYMETDLCVIDGDVLAFRASAANEKRTVIATHVKSGKEKTFNNRTELKDFVIEKQGKYNPLEYSVRDVQTPTSVAFVNHSMKMTIKAICDFCGTENYHIVVGGKDNFRDNIELPTRYKSNRDGTLRPLLLSDAKEYLVGKCGAEIANGVESDDVLTYYQYEGYKSKKKIVLCTNDKDARSHPGYLYNWTEENAEIIKVSGLGYLYEQKTDIKGYGRMFSYKQILTGDAVDGFKPTELCGVKFGDKSAYKLLKDLKTDKECWEAIAEQYKTWYPEDVTYIAWNGNTYTKSWVEILQMYVDCVHMQRWPNDRLIVSTVFDKLGIEY